MATVVVTLEVDDKGTQKIQQVSGSLKEMGGNATKAGLEFGAGFAVAQKAVDLLTDAIKEAGKWMVDAVHHVLEYVHSIETLMAKTGLAAKEAQELSTSMKLVGGDSESLASMIDKMQKNLVAGSGAFKALGLDARKLKDEDIGKAFTEVAERIQGIQNPTERTAALLAVFGKGGAEAARLINEGVSHLSEDANRLNAVLGDDGVEAVGKLGAESRRLDVAWDGLKNQFAAAIAANPALLKGLHDVVEVVVEMSTWVIKNKAEISSWVDTTVAGLRLVAAEALATARATAGLFGFHPAALDTPSGRTTGQTSGRYGSSASRSAGGVAPPAFHFDPEAEKAAAQAQEAWQKAAEKARAEWDKFYAGLEAGGKNAFQSMQNDIDKYVDHVIKEQTRAGEHFIEDLAKGRQAERDEMDYAADVDAKLAEAKQRHLEEEIAGIRDLAGVVGSLGGTWGTVGAGILNVLANLKDKSLQAASATEKIAIAAQAAISAYKGGSVLGGAASGAAAGAAFGHVGIAVGAVVGGILGLFGHNSQQAKELKDLTAQLGDLQAQAAKAGVQLHLAFNPKDAKSLKAAIDEVHKALDMQGQAQQKLNEALGRYNFTEKEKGAVLAAQDLDQKFGQIYQDYQLLTAAGVDHNAIIREMGPSMSDYVNQARSAGVAIPSAMKSIIDDMIAQGKLLDENGNAYTDAEQAGIHYAETMSDMFRDLLESVQDLVDALNTAAGIKVNHPGTTTGGGGGGATGGAAGGGRGNTSEAGSRSRALGGGHTVQVNFHGPVNAHSVEDLTTKVERGAARGLVTALRRQGLG